MDALVYENKSFIDIKYTKEIDKLAGYFFCVGQYYHLKNNFYIYIDFVLLS